VKLFIQYPIPTDPSPAAKSNEIFEFVEGDWYNLAEVQDKYGISLGGLNVLIKRNNIPKIRKGWFAYVPKRIIDKILT
jgi:hypothetical protein